MKYLLIMILATSFLFSDFTRSNSIVTDNDKHLQWTDKDKIRLTWSETIDYCTNLNLDGKGDWRMPNINELMSITDYTKTTLIDSAFIVKVYTMYWSSTSDSTDESRAYTIEFNPYGNIVSEAKNKLNFVRCVRTVE